MSETGKPSPSPYQSEIDLLELKHLRSRRWRDHAATVVQTLSAATAVVVALLIAVIFVQAWNDDSVVVTPFAVPDDLAKNGFTGDFYAAQTVDEVERIQVEAYQSSPLRPADLAHKTDVSFQLPNTSISIAQFRSAMAELFGRRTEFSGKLARDGNCLVATVKMGGNAAQTFWVAPEDHVALSRRSAAIILKSINPHALAKSLLRGSQRAGETSLAEDVGGLMDGEDLCRRTTSSNRASTALSGNTGRKDGKPVAAKTSSDAAQPIQTLEKPVPPLVLSILQDMTDSRAPMDRAWGYVGLSEAYLSVTPAGAYSERAVAAADNALNAVRDFVPAYIAKADAYGSSADHQSEAHEADRAALQLLKRGNRRGLAPDAVRRLVVTEAGYVERYEGDFLAAAKDDAETALRYPLKSMAFTAREIDDLVLDHDLDEASKRLRDAFGMTFADPPKAFLESSLDQHLEKRFGRPFGSADFDITGNLMEAYDAYLFEVEDWDGWIAFSKAQQDAGGTSDDLKFKIAYATAMKQGKDDAPGLKSKEASQSIYAQTLLGALYLERHKADAAIAIFDNAHKKDGDNPFHLVELAYAYAGQKKYDIARRTFSEAQARGPRNADVLEFWGEALIEANRSDLALAKFAQAEKFAPNWGRLHVYWGEALHWLKRDGEAGRQFDQVSRLCLAPSIKVSFEMFKKSEHLALPAPKRC